MNNKNEYLGYEVINGVFVKDLDFDSDHRRFLKPYGYLIKNVNRYNVNYRINKLLNHQQRVQDELKSSDFEKYVSVRRDKEYEYLCITDALNELEAYRTSQDYCAKMGDPDYREN